jgi:hypothetical protein
VLAIENAFVFLCADYFRFMRALWTRHGTSLLGTTTIPAHDVIAAKSSVALAEGESAYAHADGNSPCNLRWNFSEVGSMKKPRPRFSSLHNLGGIVFKSLGQKKGYRKNFSLCV